MSSETLWDIGLDYVRAVLMEVLKADLHLDMQLLDLLILG